MHGDNVRNANFDALDSYSDIFSQLPQVIETTNRGFTGHEHFDQIGIIHMNGRIYDPSIGRFLQADPIIQDPFDTQSLNRYSYVGNNPLSYTDPTGYSRLRKGWWRVPVAIAITVYTAGAASAAMTSAVNAGLSTTAGAALVNQALILSIAGGTMAGGVSSGNLKGAVKGGVFAAITFGIGHGAAGGGSPFGDGRMFAHAIAGGASAIADGGKFGHGFIAAGLTGVFDASSIGKAIQATKSVTLRVVANAIVGGSISEATGGKFANGAMSAAFRVAFNDTLTSDNAEMLEDAIKRREDLEMSGGFSPLPAEFETKWGGSVSLNMMSDFQLYPTELGEGGAQYQFDSNGLVYRPSASGRADSVAPESYLMGARWSGRFLDIFTKGRGITFGKVSFLYQLPKTQGRMIFKYGKFRLQYGKTWGRTLQPWYKRTYLKIPGRTNKHWPWD